METNITLSVVRFSGDIFLPGNVLPAEEADERKVVICGLTGTTKLRTTCLLQIQWGEIQEKNGKVQCLPAQKAASLSFTPTRSMAGKRDKISYVIKLNFVIPGAGKAELRRWESRIFFFCGKLKQTIEQTPTRTTFHDFPFIFRLSSTIMKGGNGELWVEFTRNWI